MTHVRTLLEAGSKIFTALVAAALVFTWTTNAQGAPSDDRPANKVAAAGSETQVAGPNENVVLMNEIIKVSDPTDLILNVNAECSIVSDVKTTGDGTSGAQGKADIFVTIDGSPVPISMEPPNQDTDDPVLPGQAADQDNPGEVTFCNRVYQRQTSGFDMADEQNNTIDTFHRTKSAHSFTWVALDPSRLYDANDDNILNVKVVGRLFSATNTTTGDPARAEVVVGARTLVIEPVKAAVGETITTLDPPN